MSWWQNLPSLKPLKGLVRFLYVWAHWETISDELKKRDERLQAFEDWARRMIEMEKEAHEAEKRKLERKQKEEVDAMRALISFSSDKLDRVSAGVEAIQQRAAELSEALVETVYALAIMLHIEENPAVRERVLALSSPKVRELLTEALEGFRAREVREAFGRAMSRKSSIGEERP
jgi:hypothetical protein